MAKPQILLVDADPRSVRLLEVSLRNEGFMVTHASDGADALEKLAYATPDLILTDTRLPRLDGFEFAKAVRNQPQYSALPIIFLASTNSLDDKLRGVAMGADDYLTRPVLIRELVTRVQMLLARTTQRHLAAHGSASNTQLSGTLEDMGVVDLLQTIEASHKSGTAEIVNGTETATIRFVDGRAADAELGRLRGEEAVYRALLWTSGTFVVDFGATAFEETITTTTQALLMEGMRRMDEWGRLAEQLPSLSAIFEIDTARLMERIGELPDELNPIIRLLDGSRSLATLLNESPFDDLSTLSVVSKLYFEGLLQEVISHEPVSAPTGPSLSSLPRFESGSVRRSLRPSVPLVYSEQELLKPIAPAWPGGEDERVERPTLAEAGLAAPASTAKPAAEAAVRQVESQPVVAVAKPEPEAHVPAVESRPVVSIANPASEPHVPTAAARSVATEQLPSAAARQGSSTLLGIGMVRPPEGPAPDESLEHTRPGPPVGFVEQDEPAPTTRRGHRTSESVEPKGKQVTLTGFAAAGRPPGADDAAGEPRVAAVTPSQPGEQMSAGGSTPAAGPGLGSAGRKSASEGTKVQAGAAAALHAGSAGSADGPGAEEQDFDAFFDAPVAPGTATDDAAFPIGPVPGVPAGGPLSGKLGLIALAAIALAFGFWLLRGRSEPAPVAVDGAETSATPALSTSPPGTSPSAEQAQSAAEADDSAAVDVEPEPPAAADATEQAPPAATATGAGAGSKLPVAPSSRSPINSPRRKTLRLPPPKTKPPVAAFPSGSGD